MFGFRIIKLHRTDLVQLTVLLGSQMSVQIRRERSHSNFQWARVIPTYGHYKTEQWVVRLTAQKHSQRQDKVVILFLIHTFSHFYHLPKFHNTTKSFYRNVIHIDCLVCLRAEYRMFALLSKSVCNRFFCSSSESCFSLRIFPYFSWT